MTGVQTCALPICFEAGGSACQVSDEQQEKLKAWVAAALPRTTRQIGAWIEKEFGVVYGGRSGLIALLHRLGLQYHKPRVIPRKLDKDKQKAFIESYSNLLNSLADNEAVLFADAIHPTHAARPAGCWAPSQDKLAIEQTSGRQRINIHGAIDLETGQTRMIEALTIDAASTIRLLGSGEISPIAKEQMLFKEFAALDDALSWGRPARAGRPLSSEGSSVSQALAGDPGPFDAGSLGELLPFGADHVPIDHWPLHAGRRVCGRERDVRIV